MFKLIRSSLTTNLPLRTHIGSMVNKAFAARACSSKATSSNAVYHGEHLTESGSDTYHADKEQFFTQVNQIMDGSKRKRHFAVVHMYGYQHFVREGDVFKVKREVPAKVGERIKLEKCLMVGSEEFTLVGRPLLDRNQVNVEVTVVEITQSHSYNQHIFTQRQQGKKRWRFYRHPITLLRVNTIEVKHGINQNPTEI